MKTRGLITLFAVAMMVIVIIGCGGGGSAFDAESKQVVYANSIASHQSIQGGLNVGFVSLKQTAPTGSGLGKTAKLAQALMNGKRPNVAKPLGSLSYLPFLGLYYSESSTANAETIHYFTDSAGTIDAGSLTISIQGVSSFDTNYTSYPVTINATANITAGKIPMNGSLSIVYADSSGANTMTGQLTLPTNDIHLALALNLSLADTTTASGTCTVTTPSSTYTMTNMAGNPFNTLTGDVAISPQSWTGTGAIVPGDGTFTMDLHTPQGLAHASLGLDGILTITYPDQSQTTVTDPSSAGLILGGGGSTTSTTGSTQVSFAAPVEIQTNSDTYSQAFVSKVSSNGKMIGTIYAPSTSDFIPVYWASSTGLPIILKHLNQNSSLTIKSINSLGQIVGYEGASTTPIYYSSPTAAPVSLKIPTGGSEGRAKWINDNGAIVGECTINSELNALYWSSPTANPVILPKNPTFSLARATFIDNSNVIWGDFQNYFGRWASPTATPELMKPLSGTTENYGNAVSPNGLMVGQVYNGAQDQACIWTQGSTQATLAPIGINYSTSSLNGVNDLGIAGGYVTPTGASSNTAWFYSSTQSIALNALVSNDDGWTLNNVMAVDGSSNFYVTATKNGKYTTVYLKKN